VENFEQILQASIRENVYLILKEAINNSIKHADPSKISFKVKSENKQLIFCVEDDGRKIIKPDTFRKSNGLLNMKLRSEKIGASLVVDFQQGASIMLKVPLN
ncbi:MAG: hypothetical protein KDD94_05260, partial [Calditrichaeota bacterium]|nr:hypothetical protein [Calditrichota bacterium]